MAITNGYLTLDEAKQALNITDTADDDVIERAVNGASRAIDQWCGQRFWVDSADTTRYFTPSDRSTLWLRHDGGGNVETAGVVSVTSVSVDYGDDGTYEESLTEGTHYYLYPRGAATANRPYTALQIPTSVTSYWPAGYVESVKVVGTFGWPAVPDEVKQACEIQTQVLFKRITEGPSPIVTMDGATMPGSKFLDPTVRMLLQPHRRLVSG